MSVRPFSGKTASLKCLYMRWETRFGESKDASRDISRDDDCRSCHLAMRCLSIAVPSLMRASGITRLLNVHGLLTGLSDDKGKRRACAQGEYHSGEAVSQ